MFNYKEKIEYFKKKADEDRGIEWIISDDQLTRDATNANGNIYSVNDYAQQSLNLLRAARELIEINTLQGSSILLSCIDDLAIKKAKDYEEGALSECQEVIARDDFLRLNASVVQFLSKHVLKDKSVKQINKDLRLAEAYAGLNDQHYDILTKVKVGEKTFIQKDEKISKLTDKQKNSYQNRQKEYWYQNLSGLEKGLLEKHIGQITDGKHVLSCIIKNIPGVRNAYKKTLVQVEVGKDNKTLNHYMHSAGIHTLNPDKSAAQNIPRQNYQQLQNASGSAGVRFMTLCTELPFKIDKDFDRLDRKVVAHTKSATDNKFLNIPVNSIRFASSSDTSQYLKEFFDASSNKYSNYPFIRDYLSGSGYFSDIEDVVVGINRKKALDQVSKLQSPDKEILTNLIDLKKLVTNQSGFLGIMRNLYQSVKSSLFEEQKEHTNDSARIGSILTKVAHHIDPKNPIVVSCKSGKDRTGYICYKADVDQILMHNSDLNVVDVNNAVANGGHVQFLASCGGGKPGCFGIKGVQIYGNKQSQSNLFAKAAGLSSSVPIIKSYLKEAEELLVSKDTELGYFSGRDKNQSKVATEQEKDQFFGSDQSIDSSGVKQPNTFLNNARAHFCGLSYNNRLENEDLQGDKKPSYVQRYHLNKSSLSRNSNVISG